MNSDLVQLRVDSKRGCGWRRPGLYLVLDGPAGSCGKLPIDLTKCPTCGEGIKPTRGWTWVDADALVGDKPCIATTDGFNLDSPCARCPLAGSIGRAGLLWIGGKYYATPEDFLKEAREQGISRRISAVPLDFEVGKTWVLLAHRDHHKVACPDCNSPNIPAEQRIEEQKVCETCDKTGLVSQAAIFGIFRPNAIEYIVKGDETEEELKRMHERGITPVKVERNQTEEERKAEEAAETGQRGTKERPGENTTTGKVWAIADSLVKPAGKKQGEVETLPSRAAVIEACVAQGIKKATAGTQYGRWLQSKTQGCK